MRLVGAALILALVSAGAASMVGCGAGDDSSVAPVDGSAEGSLRDSAPTDAAVDAASGDAPTDSPPQDGAPEAARVDAGGGGGSATVDSGGAPTPEAAVGTVLVTLDASVHSTSAAGECAGANSLTATPDETAVGHAMTLTASGVDSNDLSTDVTLTWAASGDAGTLASSTGTSNSFTCTSAGPETVTVTAAISGSGASCAQTGSLTVSLQCDAQ